MELIDLRLPSGQNGRLVTLELKSPPNLEIILLGVIPLQKTIMSEEPVRLTTWTSIP